MKRTYQLVKLFTVFAVSSLNVSVAHAQSSDAFTEMYARKMNITTDRAAQRIAEQSEVSALNARLQKERPDTFAGLWIEKTPELRVVVRFTGDAKGQLAAFTKDPHYVAETAPRSLELLLATQQEMMHQLNAAGINFEAGLDIKRSEITLYVLDPETAREALAELLSAVDFIRIEKTTGFIQTTAASGGHRLDGYQGTVCTSGYNVVNTTTRELGLSTAGHCDNDNYHRDPTTRIEYRDERNAGSYDMQWGAQRTSSTIHQQSNEITVNGQQIAITSIASPLDWALGADVCKFGITTGLTCGTVSDPNAGTNYNSEVGTYVRVSSADGSEMNDLGDSGGPVFFGNKAIGLVHGRGAGDRLNDLYFMPIDRLSILGVEALTAPFTLDTVPDVSGSGGSVAVAMNFSGSPRFPLTLNIEVVTCPPGWICVGGTKTYSEPGPSPITFNWACNGPSSGTANVSKVRTFLKDRSGIVTQTLETNITCTST